MNIPGRLRPPTSAEKRKRAKERITRQAEQARRGMAHLPRGMTQRRPAQLAAALIVLALAGAALVGRVQRNAQLPPSPSRSLLRAEEDLKTLRLALERFRNDCGRYPSGTEGLMALIARGEVQGWRGPYLTLLKRDPWHHAYHYQATNGMYALWSCGPDGLAGTGDDMGAENVE